MAVRAAKLYIDEKKSMSKPGKLGFRCEKPIPKKGDEIFTLERWRELGANSDSLTAALIHYFDELDKTYRPHCGEGMCCGIGRKVGISANNDNFS